ncbi:hypothetical protein I6F26_10245 [Ensifer sp. IC3342]|nr:hypothetical protein [Ensifer sp. BRP08]MCA1446959.1 hypothetical protein [Ensifer sp. IC3342]
MNWNDPVERAALIEKVGVAEYNRLIEQHFRDMTLMVVNGHAIRQTDGGRWGLLYQVGNTGIAYGSIAQAEAYAKTLPRGNAP